MEKSHILLLQPRGDHPSPVDQCFGASLAAAWGPARDRITLGHDSFQRGDLDGLQQTLRRWAGKVSGVVGATSVPESTRLGELCEQLKLLCIVSNNNPIVWQHRRCIFHIGVPTISTAASIADHMLCRVGDRIYILHDDTDFQMRVARNTEAALKNGGAEVRSKAGSEDGWLEDLLTWNPDALYLVYSEEALALPLTQAVHRAVPDLILLLGRSLLRHTFIEALGSGMDGLLFVDLFHRGSPQTQEETSFIKVLGRVGMNFPTGNHGFGWDAMTLCGLALAEASGDPLSAIDYLESGVAIEGATGRYCFSAEDHNGRSGSSPTTFSCLREGRVEMFI